MKVSYQALTDGARIWIYQNQAPISQDVQKKIAAKLDQFVESWAAHQQPLPAYAELRHDRFIILAVNEGGNMASGCSIDASIHFIRQIESDFELDLFDRMTFSFQKDGQVRTVQKAEFGALYERGEIDDDTLVFDNLVKSKKELEESWLKPLAASWHRRFVQSPAV